MDVDEVSASHSVEVVEQQAGGSTVLPAGYQTLIIGSVAYSLQDFKSEGDLQVIRDAVSQHEAQSQSVEVLSEGNTVDGGGTDHQDHSYYSSHTPQTSQRIAVDSDGTIQYVDIDSIRVMGEGETQYEVEIHEKSAQESCSIPEEIQGNTEINCAESHEAINGKSGKELDVLPDLGQGDNVMKKAEACVVSKAKTSKEIGQVVVTEEEVCSERNMEIPDADSAVPMSSDEGNPSTSKVKIDRTSLAVANDTDIKTVPLADGLGYYFKVVHSKEEVNKVINCLQKELGVVFQVKKVDANFGSTDWKPRNLKGRKEKPGSGNVFWSYDASLKENNASIPYDGVPFMHVSNKVLQCIGSESDGSVTKLALKHFRKTYRKRGRKKGTKAKNETQTEDAAAAAEADAVDETTVEHLCCPYKIGIKQVVKFPRYSFTRYQFNSACVQFSSMVPPSQKVKTLVRTAIMEGIEKNRVEQLGGEMKYYMRIPFIDLHCNHKLQAEAKVQCSDKYRQWLLQRLFRHTDLDMPEPSMSHVKLQYNNQQIAMAKVHSLVLSSGSSVFQYSIERDSLINSLVDILSPMNQATMQSFLRFLYCGELVIEEGCSLETLAKAFETAKLPEAMKLLENHKQQSGKDWLDNLKQCCNEFKVTTSTQTCLEDFCAESGKECVDTSGIKDFEDFARQVNLKLKPENGEEYVQQVASALMILFPQNASFHQQKILTKWTMAGFSLGEIVRQVFMRRLQKIGLLQEVQPCMTAQACKACTESCHGKGHFINPDNCDKDIGTKAENSDDLCEFIREIVSSSKQDQNLDTSEIESKEPESGKQKSVIHLSKKESAALQTLIEGRQDLGKTSKSNVIQTPQSSIKVIVPKTSPQVSSSVTSTPKLPRNLEPKMADSLTEDTVIVFNDPQTGARVTKRMFSDTASEIEASPKVMKREPVASSTPKGKNPFVVRVAKANGTPQNPTPFKKIVTKSPVVKAVPVSVQSIATQHQPIITYQQSIPQQPTQQPTYQRSLLTQQQPVMAEQPIATHQDYNATNQQHVAIHQQPLTTDQQLIATGQHPIEHLDSDQQPVATHEETVVTIEHAAISDDQPLVTQPIVLTPKQAAALIADPRITLTPQTTANQVYIEIAK